MKIKHIKTCNMQLEQCLEDIYSLNVSIRKEKRLKTNDMSLSSSKKKKSERERRKIIKAEIMKQQMKAASPKIDVL